jgi:uncharacterized protein (TIGR03435 family)
MRTALTLSVTAIALVTAHAQTPAPAAAPTVAFEAASIKPDDGSGQGQRIFFEANGRFTVDNIPLRGMIVTGYGIQAYQLIGAPAWVNNDRWDVLAKLPANLPPPLPGSGPGGYGVGALRLMLEDRFKLKVHRETREMDIYHLVLARPDKKLGPEMKQAGDDCTPEGQARRKQTPPDQLKPLFCGIRGGGPGKVSLMGMPLSFYATNLTNTVGRYVVDKTGLEGRWDFTLAFTPDGPLPPGAPAPDSNVPNLFTALQEQLGLKLEAAKGPVDIVVVDSVERPTPD